MKNIFVALHRILNLVQTFMVLLAFLCIAIWFYRFLNLAYDGNGFFQIIEFVPNIVRGLIPYTIDFGGRPIDISYFPAAIILFVIHVIIKLEILEYLEKVINECIQKEYKAREQEELVVNKEIEEDIKNQTLAYRCFVGLLDLKLDYIADEALIGNKKPIDALKQEGNKSIMYDIYQKHKIKCALKGDKIVILCENFSTFDGLLLDIIDKIKQLYKINKVNSVQTSFTLACDAITDASLSRNSVKILEKISSFRYYNKIIVTTVFASRYGYCNHPRFELRTMGISRFFEKTVDKEGETKFKSEDFDLYSLKLRDKDS